MVELSLAERWDVDGVGSLGGVILDAVIGHEMFLD